MTFRAENFMKGPVVLLTEDIQNLRLDGLNHASKIRKIDKLNPLPRAVEREYEEVRYETVNGLLD